MAIIVDALASQFKETLTALITDEVVKILGAKDELKRLQSKLGLLRDVLVDAEQKGLASAPIRNWLANFKDLIYDADDVIDYYRTVAERLAGPPPPLDPHSPRHSTCFPPVLSCFRRLALRRQIAGRIRAVNARLEELVKEKNDFDLSLARRDDDHSGSTSTSSKVRRPPADSLPEPIIVGAGVENDARNIAAQLTAAAVDGQPVTVHAIVGMGGIGKTTLAQMIFNHKDIKDAFRSPSPMWVPVSKECSETALFGDIIRQAGGEMGQNAAVLRQVVEGKKFFLVLDDVWDARVWTELLRKPLLSGAAGSRILVTTRNEQVAKGMGAVSLHRVQPLPPEDAWSLVAQTVFDASEQAEMELLRDVGMEIVFKCEGLPLALTTIAAVLSGKPKRKRGWEMVRDNPAWSMSDLPDGVMGALYMSYEDLPYPLKQCFVFCSLFPEDHVFTRHAVIQHWVAEGFVPAERGAIMEEVGRGYFQELLRRSLFQRDPRIYDDAGCTMHDLVRSLARFLARHDTFVGDIAALPEASSSVSTKVRHLSVIDFMAEEFPAALKQYDSLRTLFMHIVMLMAPLPDDLFAKLGRLRVLDFRNTSVKTLPASIGDLIHLRYLDISGAMLEELPDSIEQLSNLQFLLLQGCAQLKRLPKGIARLYKLRCLDLLGTMVEGMPAGIGRLRQLSRLAGFVINEGGGEWCSLEELRSLTELRDLTLEKLEKAAAATAVDRGSILEDMGHLRGLKFRCSTHGHHHQHGEEEQAMIKKFFDELLCPPDSVEKFEIEGYYGAEFPRWMIGPEAAGLFANLRRLDLRKCPNCRLLPPLGLLPRVDHISIKDASAVHTIGPEFMGWAGDHHVRRPAFPMLKSMKLSGLHNWSEWRWEATDEANAMARLETLELKECPRLESLPNGLHRHAAALSTMTVQAVHSLRKIENFPSLKALAAIMNYNLSRVSNLPALEHLRIIACPALRGVERVDALQGLELFDAAMETLPDWLLPRGETEKKPPFPHLRALYITVGRVEVLHRCLVDGADWPKIEQFPHAYIQCQPPEMFDEFWMPKRPLFVFYMRDPFTLNTNLNLKADEDGGGDVRHADA